MEPWLLFSPWSCSTITQAIRRPGMSCRMATNPRFFFSSRRWLDVPLLVFLFSPLITSASVLPVMDVLVAPPRPFKSTAASSTAFSQSCPLNSYLTRVSVTNDHTEAPLGCTFPTDPVCLHRCGSRGSASFSRFAPTMPLPLSRSMSRSGRA